MLVLLAHLKLQNLGPQHMVRVSLRWKRCYICGWEANRNTSCLTACAVPESPESGGRATASHFPQVRGGARLRDKLD